ncbi:MAG: pyrroline-5-carboxylate reductase [Lachnospiraceae bacterium]|nr:pyrroline-5-carboxylate reductase [Lachnospiraceae bacterium]
MIKKYKLGLIGCGNMGRAILQGVLSSDVVSREEVAVSVHSEESREALEKDFGCLVTVDNKMVAENAEMLLLAVKPYQLSDVLAQIRESIEADQIIISVIAGKSIHIIEEGLMSIKVAGRLKVARAMPNTPAKVGESMSALCPNAFMTETDTDRVARIFSAFGRAQVVDEGMMDVVTGVSGSSPAFVYMFMEAMADAAVAHGMSRDTAYLFVSQTVLGAAKMLRDTGMHPGALKDAVCSPGGTTIAGVLALEEAGLRRAVIAGVDAAIEAAERL